MGHPRPTHDETGYSRSAVTAVVVVWNSGRDAIELMKSLDGAFAAGLKMVLVDNGSVDATLAVLRTFLDGWEHGARVKLVETGANLGFTGGVNFGTDAALNGEPSPDFIWLLNPDATTNPETLAELVAVANESGAGVVMNHARYLKPDAWPAPFYTVRSGAWSAVDHGRWWPVGAYYGTCALFDAKLVRALITSDGHFQDPGIFMDWDEWECTHRIRKLGYSIVMARDTLLVHDDSSRTLGGSRMAAVRQYYVARNAIVIARRNIPAGQFWPLLGFRLLRDLSWFARVGLRGKKPHPGSYLLGTLDGLRGKMGRWEKHPAALPPSTRSPKH